MRHLVLKNVDVEPYPLQARYFKSMLKATDHLERVKRLRVSDKDVSHLMPYYKVSVVFWFKVCQVLTS